MTDVQYAVLPVDHGYPIKMWNQGVPMEDSVLTQATNLAAVPGVLRVAIMPDAHMGHGAAVGSAILTEDIVIPAAVGVDIGCGMVAAPLNLHRSDLPEGLAALRAAIEVRIPVGRTNNGQKGDRGAWGEPPEDVMTVWTERLRTGYEAMVAKYPAMAHQFVTNHLGTLGTGNHFIEVCIEQAASVDPRVWLMLHSGSRGVGNKIGTGFTKLAQTECKRWHVDLPDPELAFLPRGTDLFRDYLMYANWAQGYAWQSREIMFARLLDGVRQIQPDAQITYDELVHCSHNYVAEERHFGKAALLTRKGAVNAARGVMGIIPGSMGTRSYITRGLGSPESLMTSSHGAGRVMSRNAARKAITLEQHLAAVDGVECRLDDDVIDESPAAYKPVEAVMRAQSDLTEPVHILKQIVVVKG